MCLSEFSHSNFIRTIDALIHNRIRINKHPEIKIKIEIKKINLKFEILSAECRPFRIGLDMKKGSLMPVL